MPNQAVALPRSKWRSASLGNRKIVCSPLTGVQAASNTYIPTVQAGYVALIDVIRITCQQQLAAINATLTISLSGGSLRFISRADAAVSKNQDFSIFPNGSLVVTAGTAMTMQASVTSNWFTQVEYRLVPIIDAIAAGYLPGVPFVASVIAGAPTDIIAAATVTSTRGLDVQGMCITGSQQTATGAANKEVLIGFIDSGGATERKIVKNCYGGTNSVDNTPMLIDRCRVRGPLGYGIRATMGDANAAVSVWGFYYDTAQGQRTWPGTGLIPSAGDAFDCSDYFWLYTEATAAAIYELFPATTGAKSRNTYTVDGFVGSVSGNTSTSNIVGLAFGDTLAPCGPSVLFSGEAGGAGNAGNSLGVFQNLGLPFRVDGRVGVGVTTGGAASAKVGALVWGRFGGNQYTDGYRTDLYTNGA